MESCVHEPNPVTQSEIAGVNFGYDANGGGEIRYISFTDEVLY